MFEFDLCKAQGCGRWENPGRKGVHGQAVQCCGQARILPTTNLEMIANCVLYIKKDDL